MKNCNCCTTYNAPDRMDGGVTAARIEQEAEQPHPLTPDAITDEQQERARDAVLAMLADQEPRPPFATVKAGKIARAALRAAFTPPPSRPGGAEELARLIATADVGEWDCGDLADALLATGRVRVVTEEQP